MEHVRALMSPWWGLASGSTPRSLLCADQLAAGGSSAEVGCSLPEKEAPPPPASCPSMRAAMRLPSLPSSLPALAAAGTEDHF